MIKRPAVQQGPNAAWARLVAETSGTPTRTKTLAEFLREEKRRPEKIDGRSLRKTGRTEQFNVRLKAGTKQDIQALADAQDWLIGEVIEHAIAALKEKLGQKP